MTATESVVKPNRRRSLQTVGLAILTGIPVLLIPALEWLPWISAGWRPWLIIAALLLAGIGITWNTRRNNVISEALLENERLKLRLRTVDPEYLLQLVAAPIFGEGAWRLTVYKKQLLPSASGGDRLIKLASVASDGDQSKLHSSFVALRPATLFQHLFESNLADARYRRAEQSGTFEGDTNSEAWSTWRDGIFGRPMEEDADNSTFRARKYAWYAAQDPRSQAVFTAIAESAHAEGIVVEHLEHVLTPPWLFFVAMLAESRSTFDRAQASQSPVEARAREALRLDMH